MAYHAITSGKDTDGNAVASVVVVMRHRVSQQGRCTWEGEGVEVMAEPATYDDLELPQPMLRRDTDVYGWRRVTDVVVQGSVRSQEPVTSLPVILRCQGEQVSFSLELVVSGDRRVDRTPSGLRLSDPEPFQEMPLRYDKAYGGTDRAAMRDHTPPKARQAVIDRLGEAFWDQPSLYPYPRNPVGKGYLVDLAGAEGLDWPNVEFPGELLTLGSLCAGGGLGWPNRPYPAGLDWYTHTWFPRSAHMGLCFPTPDKKVPPRELELGLLEPDLYQRPLMERVGHGIAQGSHPYLQRHRLQGDERISVTAMGQDGGDFVVELSPYRPGVHVTQPDQPEEKAPTVLDCVFLEPDHQRVTLVWRGSIQAHFPGMKAGWEQLCTYRVAW